MPIHSAIVISKLKALLSLLSILDPQASDPLSRSDSSSVITALSPR